MSETQATAVQDTKTKMVQPPNPDKTKMVSPEKKTEQCRWIKALKPIRLPDGKMLTEGDAALVDIPTAKEFCLKKFVGTYTFSGERSSKNADAQLPMIVRAMVITEKEGLRISEQMKLTHKSHLDEELPEPEELPEAL